MRYALHKGSQLERDNPNDLRNPLGTLKSKRESDKRQQQLDAIKNTSDQTPSIFDILNSSQGIR